MQFHLSIALLGFLAVCGAQRVEVVEPQDRGIVTSNEVVLQWAAEDIPDGALILLEVNGQRIGTTEALEGQTTINLPEGEYTARAGAFVEGEDPLAMSRVVTFVVATTSTVSPEIDFGEDATIEQVNDLWSKAQAAESNGKNKEAFRLYLQISRLAMHNPHLVSTVFGAPLEKNKKKNDNSNISIASLALFRLSQFFLIHQKNWEKSISAAREALEYSPHFAAAHAAIASLSTHPLVAAHVNRAVAFKDGVRHASAARRLHARGGNFHAVARELLGGEWMEAVEAIGEELKNSARRRPKVALLTSATGSYRSFIVPLIESAEKYLLSDCCDVFFIVFTDRRLDYNTSTGSVRAIKRDHGGWPRASLNRSGSYLQHKRAWADMDYVFAIDVDCAFVRHIGRELLGSTVANLHADNAFYRGIEVLNPLSPSRPIPSPPATMWKQSKLTLPILAGAVYERRKQSQAAMGEGEGEYYFAGGFYGGTTEKVVELLEYLVSNTEKDDKRGITALVHDESHLNRWMATNPPEVILSPAYLYPEPSVVSDDYCQPPGVASCVRDSMHPWLWIPWDSSSAGQSEPWTPSAQASARRYLPRMLNLSKDKWGLQTPPESAKDV